MWPLEFIPLLTPNVEIQDLAQRLFLQAPLLSNLMEYYPEKGDFLVGIQILLISYPGIQEGC